MALTITKDQQDALAKARESALRLKRFADKARALGLPILEQWLRDASVGCQAGVDFQERAFQDNLLSQSGKAVIDHESRIDSKKLELANDSADRLSASVDTVTRSPMITGGEEQADKIIEAIKRKGYAG